jgi:hypothetical protein
MQRLQRPANQLRTVLQSDFLATLANLKQRILLHNEQAIRDANNPALSADKRKRRIKGNVRSTAFHIYQRFLQDNKEAVAKAKYCLKTFHSSLATLSQNCVRTIQRHVDILLQTGILKAKDRNSRGLDLVLDIGLLAFKEVIKPIKQSSAPAAIVEPVAPTGDARADFFRQQAALQFGFTAWGG